MSKEINGKLASEVLDFISKQKIIDKEYCQECGRKSDVGFLCAYCGLCIITKETNGCVGKWEKNNIVNNV